MATVRQEKPAEIRKKLPGSEKDCWEVGERISGFKEKEKTMTKGKKEQERKKGKGEERKNCK